MRCARFSHAGTNGRVSDPDRGSYCSLRLLQGPGRQRLAVRRGHPRLPGRIDPAETAFASVNDLASALRRAEAAHGEHEKRTGQRDENWPDWYAAYMMAEQAGTELPT